MTKISIVNYREIGCSRSFIFKPMNYAVPIGEGPLSLIN